MSHSTFQFVCSVWEKLSTLVVAQILRPQARHLNDFWKRAIICSFWDGYVRDRAWSQLTSSEPQYWTQRSERSILASRTRWKNCHEKFATKIETFNEIWKKYSEIPSSPRIWESNSHWLHSSVLDITRSYNDDLGYRCVTLYHNACITQHQ